MNVWRTAEIVRDRRVPTMKGRAPVGLSAKTMGATLLVRLDDELDLHTSSDFKAMVATSFQRNPALRHLVLSLDEVTFIDSVGIGAILGRYREVSRAGGQVRIVGAKPHVHRLLAMSGVLKLIETYASEGQALVGL